MSEAKERELRQQNLKELMIMYLEENGIRDKKAVEYIGVNKNTFSLWINDDVKKLSIEAERKAWEFILGYAYRPITSMVSIEDLNILPLDED